MPANFLKTELPLVAAPMAGGPSTVKLAQAVAKAGAFPFLAGGYKTVETLSAEIEELRSLTQNFGVNLFAPSKDSFDQQKFTSFAAAIAPDAAVHGIELNSRPRTSDDLWEEKLAYLEEHPVPVVSFTFGLPAPEVFARLKAVGTLPVASVTTPTEAQAAEANGAGALVVQGPRAGGHSATFDPTRIIKDISTAELLQQVKQDTHLPLIAAGGVAGASDVKELLDAGASAVAIGTLLLRTTEAGTSATHQQALGDPRFEKTELTSVFTGRPARALVNNFLEEHRQQAIIAYPQVHFLTSALRKAAGAAGDAERLHLWAGTGWKSARQESATDTIRRLAAHL